MIYSRKILVVIPARIGSKGIKIGRECKIGKFSILRVPSSPFLKGKQITIDDFSTIGEFCFIGGAASVKIGKNNSIGQYVSIHPHEHMHIYV